MSNRYKIYSEIHFGIIKLAPGVKTMEELLDIAELYRKDKDFSNVYYQLNDLRDCTFNFKPDRIGEMKSLIDRFMLIDNQRLGIYLVNQPTETAYLHIFFKSLNYTRKFCSSLEKAYSLLALPISFDEFKQLVDI